jgi:hypothetical protein
MYAYYIFQEAFQRRLKEAGDTGLDPHLAWSQEVGGRNRGRYYGLPGIIDKAQIGPLSKSTPGSSGRNRTQMFTQDQVQEMINRATQQLNETWENRFQSLEQSMLSMASPNIPQVNLSWFIVQVRVQIFILVCLSAAWSVFFTSWRTWGWGRRVITWGKQSYLLFLPYVHYLNRWVINTQCFACKQSFLYLSFLFSTGDRCTLSLSWDEYVK